MSAAVGGLLVAEMFATVQGEGPSCGQQALFVRLSRCNLSCPSCDTPYTWDWSRFDPAGEATRRSTDAVLGWVLDQPARLVVVTGGEPLLQQAGLVPLLAELVAAGRRVEVETNGTVVPDPAVADLVDWNVSPKLAGFSAPRDQLRRIVGEALEAFARTGRARFKFVASGPADLDEIAGLQQRFGLDPVWVMPEGTAADQVRTGLQGLADEVVRRGWNLTSRLYVLAWGDVRGR
ncbi:organic radical activating enzyme [Micromonospora sp. Llam0]|uniref:7-carboxy-7-deazaguanine synthase QueE n=1 Tax=Micromonospora sp. Llam0 TaxID=2485143 RepID=UPI000F48713B|nr:7-carboxy-7-deazaguanine synthase QueE [Micromonospora sp. Llam0]ROO51265.1 organic radical activating enzyme [Micromonospora sp. Llam0]